MTSLSLSINLEIQRDCSGRLLHDPLRADFLRDRDDARDVHDGLRLRDVLRVSIYHFDKMLSY